MHTRCEACGGENPLSNKYCGMCGAGLGEARANSIFGNRESRRAVEEDEHDDDRIETPFHEHREERHETQYDEENRNDPYPASRNFSHPANGNGLSLFQTAAASEEESIDWSEQEPSRPYRYYIGAVLAVVILVLGYMAWRGTQGSQNSHQASAPPPPAASDTAPAPAPSQAPAKSAAEPSTQSSVPALPSEVSAHTSPPQEVPKNPADTRRDTRTANTAVPAPTPVSQPSMPAAQATLPAAGNGGEELAMAEHYLNAGVGQRRDSAEAAKWLWKSVAKHNGQATVLLSDLYLKGDGVSKNCDQARVLLDSAARKGVAGAGERLRNLPAFGCE
jgi:cytoskeletal protein RodZ